VKRHTAVATEPRLQKCSATYRLATSRAVAGRGNGRAAVLIVVPDGQKAGLRTQSTVRANHTPSAHTCSEAAHPDYSELQTWHTVDCGTNRPRGLAATTDSTRWSSTNLTSCSAPFPLPVVPINQIVQQQLHNPVLLKARVELQQDLPTDRWLCSTRDSTSSCMIGNVAVIRLGLLAHTERGPR
jgi:hypothetical protein